VKECAEILAKRWVEGTRQEHDFLGASWLFLVRVYYFVAKWSRATIDNIVYINNPVRAQSKGQAKDND